MTALINEFVNRVEFDSYEDFRDNFRIRVPENFNFAYDVVDRYAEIEPDKVALVWCNDHGEEKRITFGELQELSRRAASFFTGEGIKKGDTVMLTLKARYDFWYALLGLHRIGP